MYCDKIEWEYLQNEKVIYMHHVSEFKSELELKNINKISLKRDEDNYDILAEICGESYPNLFENLKTPYSHFDITLKMSFGTILLKGCTIINCSIKNVNSYIVKLHVFEVKWKSKDYFEKEVMFVKEWYINASSDFNYTYTTNFNHEENYIKNREFLEEEIKIKNFPQNTFSKDSCFINLKDYSFILQKVPDEYAPNFSSKLGIEYNEKFNIPSKNDRNKLTIILSFLMGRYLLKVGESHYDQNWDIIYQYSSKPPISSIISLNDVCSSPDVSPIKINPFDKIEPVYELIINNYLYKNNLDLDSTLRQLLLSTMLPAEAEIIMIGASFDNLINKWYKHNSVKKVHIEKKEFNKLLKDELEQIEIKLKNYPQVIENINNAFLMSSIKSKDNFFKSINLERGDVETKAQVMRNKPAHGGDLSNKSYIELVILNNAYRSFLNRIILKLLNYPKYYDLIAFKVRDISEPMSIKDYNNAIERSKIIEFDS